MQILLLILKLINSAVMILLPLAVLIRDWKFNDKRTKRHHNITRNIIAVWCVAGIITVCFIWYETHRASILSSKIDKLVSGNDKLLRQNKEMQIEIQKLQSEMKQSMKILNDRFEQLSKADGLVQYLADIKIESWKKYLLITDLEKLQQYLQEFSQNFKQKDDYGLKSSVEKILNVIPTDPYFRVFSLLFHNGMMNELFENKIKIVQVVRWDWVVEGDETAKLYVFTYDKNGNVVTYGPLTNNVISMLDEPVRKKIKIRVETHGTGTFEWYPRTFRIGWAVAEKQSDGNWKPILGLAEYDPFFRIGLDGTLEY